LANIRFWIAFRILTKPNDNERTAFPKVTKKLRIKTPNFSSEN